MIYIAIDPGTVSGFIAVDTMQKTRDMKGLNFWQCIRRLNFYKEKCRKDGIDIQVYIEDPNLIKTKVYRRLKGEAERNIATIAEHIGRNRRDAELMIDYCKSVSLPVQGLLPYNGGKVDGKAFEEVTGIKTNQHCRDAYMILVRKHVIPFNKNQFFNFDKL